MTTAALNSPNTHMSADTLQAELGNELERLEQQCGESVSLELLGKLKPVADATTKFLIRTRAGHPLAVVVCARPIAPGLVQRGTDNAEAIRERIGDDLGRAIIKPIGSGTVDGRSYVILPYCRDFASWRPRRILQRLRIQRPMLNWLRRANEAAAKTHGRGEAVTSAYHAALEHLERQKLFDGAIQRAIRTAIDRLESGAWRPRHTFDHNDLYLSNIMLPEKTPLSGSRPRYPFVLIDWAGASPTGFGIYDLIRLARAFNLSDATLRRELAGHASALGSDFRDAPGHMLATFGRLHVHLEHFPLELYLRTAQACWKTITRAVQPADQT